MHAGIALLNAAIVSAADELTGPGEQCGANGNAAFGEADARFVKRDCKHGLVESEVGHVNPLCSRISELIARA
jgi:hypothetical protein